MKVRFDGKELINCETDELFGIPGLFNCQLCGASFQVTASGPTQQVTEGSGSCQATHVFEDEFLVSP